MARRLQAAIAALVALGALALPAGAAQDTTAIFALAGEARGLELGVGTQGITLGVALARADSEPSAKGAAAGQCTLLGDDPDPDSLPCSESTSAKSSYPGDGGTGKLQCAAELPPPLNDVVDLKLACGSSQSGLTKGLPFTRNHGKVAGLDVTLPVGAVLGAAPVDPLVDSLTETLAPVLDHAPEEVRDAVGGLVEVIDELRATDALRIELAPSFSRIQPKGKKMTVSSDSAGALIGLVGIPEGHLDGTGVSASANPLENGLVIIEIGRAQASASIETESAAATAAATPALVTVKVRDITKPEPTYVTITVAPGQTQTVLAGTPAESTITAADATVEEDGSSARAVADAVRLHLLKGVNGGVILALARATAAVNGDSVKPTAPVKKAPDPLPLTGGIDRIVPGLLLLGLATVSVALRKRARSDS
ncbi:MAG TPA: hypothetical protein VG408_11015 [Actinomycetota bacterium]|nr:hypothetical protein [Actinomycetota bacterium]